MRSVDVARGAVTEPREHLEERGGIAAVRAGADAELPGEVPERSNLGPCARRPVADGDQTSGTHAPANDVPQGVATVLVGQRDDVVEQHEIHVSDAVHRSTGLRRLSDEKVVEAGRDREVAGALHMRRIAVVGEDLGVRMHGGEDGRLHPGSARQVEDAQTA